MSATLSSALERDWANLLRTQSFVAALADIEGVDDLALANLGSKPLAAEQADLILHALLVAHAAGSFPAGRAVLQVMLPAMRAIMNRRRAGYPDQRDLEQETAAAMWDAISTYDTRRSHRVATRLQGHVLRRVFGELSPRARSAAQKVRGGGITEVSADEESLEHVLAAMDRDVEADSGMHCMQAATLGAIGEVLDVIAWGMDAAVISADEAALLTRLHAPDPARPEYGELDRPRGGQYQARVAAELGISHAALRTRASRAMSALASAVPGTW
jgi:DNA-directed RNA polymerase specialized sigma24 family protein